jgi:hypothetical protein
MKTSKIITIKFINEFVSIIAIAKHIFGEKLLYYKGEYYLEACPYCGNKGTHNRAESFMTIWFDGLDNRFHTCDCCSEGGDGEVSSLISIAIKSDLYEDIEKYVKDLMSYGFPFETDNEIEFRKIMNAMRTLGISTPVERYSEWWNKLYPEKGDDDKK